MIHVVKTKELKSTTKVEGILVLMSNGQWYGISRMQSPPPIWMIRGSLSSRTGRLSMDDIFMKKCLTKPELQEGINMLIGILNGEEPIKDKLI